MPKGRILIVDDEPVISESLSELLPETAVILLTGQGTVEMALRAIQEEGAFHYLEKPIDFAKLRLVVERADEYAEARRENLALRLQLRDRADATNLRAHRAGRAVLRLRPAHGRVGHGQGAVRAHDSQPEPAQEQRLRRHQLLGHPRDVDGVGAVRPRARRLHRRCGAAARLL